MSQGEFNTNLADLANTSHCTIICGINKESGKIIFFKSYDYKKDSEQAQSDLKKVIESGLGWRIGSVDILDGKFQEE